MKQQLFTYQYATIAPLSGGQGSVLAMLNSPNAGESYHADCQTWLGNIAGGDEQALGALYDATITKVYGLALRITGSAESAEEVSEDVYLQAWREASRYDASRAKAITWLLTLCRSRALDHLRRRDKAETHPQPETLNTETAQHDGQQPIDILLATERESVVHAALYELSAVQRQLIAFAYYRDMSHRQIAEQVDMPLGTVKSHLRNAISALKKHLGSGTGGVQ